MGCVDEVSQQLDCYRAVEESPHLATARAAPTSPLNEKLQVDQFYLDSAIAPDASSKYFLPAPVPSKNPLEVRGAICISRIAVSGSPGSLQTDFCAERQIDPQFQASGAPGEARRPVAPGASKRACPGG